MGYRTAAAHPISDGTNALQALRGGVPPPLELIEISLQTAT
jgi:hypothetical protein